MRGVVDKVSCFAGFGRDVFQVCFGEVVDVVLEFLCGRAYFGGDGEDCFEEGGEFFRREDDERDGTEDDEFLPADVEHGGIVGVTREDCKGRRLPEGEIAQGGVQIFPAKATPSNTERVELERRA